MINHWLMPKWEPGVSLPNIPHQQLHDRGIKGMVLDVDRTIVAGKKIVLPNSVIEWIKESKKKIQIQLLSNNPSKKRIEKIAHQLDLKFTYGAAKPRRAAVQKVLRELQLNPLSIAMIGDRLFTDVLVGNRLGLYTVLVRPIDSMGNSSHNDNIQKLEQSIAKMLGAK